MRLVGAARQLVPARSIMHIAKGRPVHCAIVTDREHPAIDVHFLKSFRNSVLVL